VREDDGIRFGTTVESLSKLKSAFPQWGNSTTTGGNASQITDGAAAVLLMTRNEAKRRGLPILGKFVTTAVAGETSCSAFSTIFQLGFRRPTTHHGYWSGLCHPFGTEERRVGIERR